jgi:hypothetical protein
MQLEINPAVKAEHELGFHRLAAIQVREAELRTARAQAESFGRGRWL